jgi:protein NrfC
MHMTEETKEKKRGGVSRRRFIINSGAAIIGGGNADAFLPSESSVEKQSKATKEAAKQAPTSFPVSKVYLVYDSSKCVNCATCMLACSTVHEGKESYSLSRIQMLVNTYNKFPDDIEIFVCRQCVIPACVQACPTGACHIDTANGNVRVIDETKCTGSRHCLESCPFVPHRIIWNHEIKKSSMCDLCIKTPYWSEKGGPDGKQACVEVCPHKALKVVKEVPLQTGEMGYNVDLKSAHYLDIIGKSQEDAAKDYLKDNPGWWPVK